MVTPTPVKPLVNTSNLSSFWDLAVRVSDALDAVGRPGDANCFLSTFNNVKHDPDAVAALVEEYVTVTE